jgi:Rps23 Pro-64 3,4-dihydroxylase Tpa1-like proline 4-hydroxylase
MHRHPHIDKDNTPHYDFSGLLYLADYEEEFTGGMFAFIDKKTTMKRIQEIEPARGRLVMFTSGKENFHQVRKVKNGTRYLMSMWFSCDPKKEFTNFLDGHMHQHFN